MGTRFELVLPGGEGHRAAGEAALDEILSAHHRYSRFDEASLLSHILRSAEERPVPLDGDSVALFRDILTVWRDSGGAFDPTAPHRGMEAIQLNLDSSSIRLIRPVPSLDLGGIAKGHALDIAARALRAHGIMSAFLHGGTSSAVGIGAPDRAEGWTVALASGGTVRLRDAALSVSAVWDGNPHPTLDPRTGRPVWGPRSASVTGPSARLADAWSTAALVLGTVPAELPDGYVARVTGG